MRPNLNYLSEEDMNKIHQLSLQLLEEMGIELNCQEARDYLEKAGAAVEGNIVKIPREIVEKALETVPKRDDFILYGMDPEHDINLKEDGPFLAAMPAATSVIDPYTREKRRGTLEDITMLTRIQDRLDVGMVSGMIYPKDVQMDIADWYIWAENFKNTKKHINGSAVGKQGVRDIAAMAQIALGDKYKFEDRPCASVCILSTPPMRLGQDALDVLIEAANLNMTMLISSGGLMGISAPMTIESATIAAHAELLAITALTQLVRPGVQVIYCNAARSIDMGTMSVQMVSPESVILRSIGAEMGRFVNMPTLLTNTLRDSKVLDAQAGFETALGGVVGAMNADGFYGIQLDDDLVVDFADLPFMHECMQQFRRLIRPLDFSDERIDLENIMEVGHGGNYLDSMHTLEYFRDELWQPDLKEHGNWETWKAAGGKTMEERCVDRVRELIEELKTAKYLTDEQNEQIDQIVRDATDKAKGVRR